jgi:REP element-mobilizing transposase RayT
MSLFGGEGWYSRGYLPHFDDARVIQTVTYRLADSLPADALARLDAERRAGLSDAERRERIDDLIDAGLGACWLRRPQIADIVVGSWRHFDGVRYLLHAWVVMPNHVHIVVHLIEPHTLSTVIKGWKSFTTRRINETLGRRGSLWQIESWDRFIRNQEHYDAAIAYVHNNPVKAGLVSRPDDWPWSSARYAAEHGGP